MPYRASQLLYILFMKVFFKNSSLIGLNPLLVHVMWAGGVNFCSVDKPKESVDLVSLEALEQAVVKKWDSGRYPFSLVPQEIKRREDILKCLEIIRDLATQGIIQTLHAEDYEDYLRSDVKCMMLESRVYEPGARDGERKVQKEANFFV